MALRTEGDKVLFQIFARTAPVLYVMDFETGHRSAHLASPTIPLEDAQVESAVSLSPKTDPLSFRDELIQAASPACGPP